MDERITSPTDGSKLSAPFQNSLMIGGGVSLNSDGDQGMFAGSKSVADVKVQMKKNKMQEEICPPSCLVFTSILLRRSQNDEADKSGCMRPTRSGSDVIEDIGSDGNVYVPRRIKRRREWES